MSDELDIGKRGLHLAAFLSLIKIVDGNGGQVGFGRITREDGRGCDITLSLPDCLAMKMVKACPETLAEAYDLLTAKPSGEQHEGS